EELIAQVMNDAKQRIRKVKEGGFQGKDYSVILCDLIKEAAMSAGGGDLEVLLSEDEGKYVSQCDLDKIAEEVSKEVSKTRIVLSDGALTGLGGVIIKTKDGRIEVNNTFEKRIERHSSTLRAEIVKVLWGE
ncbi:MAG: V-type ATP synthase subunit E family protein, partial [Methanocellales archaeon]|nr:V-type ATP synthase subunit E family protein [Methanocellales archaeon]